jgi:integrase
MQLDLFQSDPEPNATAQHRDGLFPRRRARPLRTPTLPQNAVAVSQAPERPTRVELERVTRLDALRADADRYADASYADRTRRARQRDWDVFSSWCAEANVAALPAEVDTLRCYLAHLRKLGRKVSTIRFVRTSIGLMHEHSGQPRPDRTARTREVERGMAKVDGGREEGAAPLLDHDLARIVATLGDSPRDVRDRAMLLLGFAGAFRSAELAALRVDDLTFHPGGVLVHVVRSKEDQLGMGAYTKIPRGVHPETCPVAALGRWMGIMGRPAGPLFRVIEGAQIEHQRVSERAISRAVQRACARAGLEGRYSSHSLRKGLCTSAYIAGRRRREIQEHARIKSSHTLERYLFPELLADRPSIAAGLL